MIPRKRPLRKSKGRHTSSKFPDHDHVLDHLVRNSKKYEIPPYDRILREKRIKSNGHDINPDLVFFHEKKRVTIIEAGTSPFYTSRMKKLRQLEKDKEYFEELGYECRCLEAYLKNGRLRLETPLEFLFEKIEER